MIVHRLLAACIGADSTYPELLDKKNTSNLCNNLNYRNRMAQYAGRASVALNTHLFFRGRTQEEDGYILFVKKNALQVLIPKFGLEGTIYLSSKKASDIKFTYCEEEHTQEYDGIVFRAFDPVTIRLSLDTSNVQHEKLVFEMVKPYIKGFSVDPLPEQMAIDDAAADETASTASKRKSELAKSQPIPEPSLTKKDKKNKKQKK